MEKKSGFRGIWKKLTASREVSLLLVLILLCAVVQMMNSSFLTPKTINDLLKNYSTTIVMSLGMLSVLLIGGIDISVGATLAFSGMCASLFMRDGVYSSTLMMFVVSTAIGLCCGALVGLVIAKGKVQPIIATLAIEQGIRLNILSADTRSIGEKTFGNMVLGLPEDETEAARALIYLREIPGVTAEEVTDYV